MLTPDQKEGDNSGQIHVQLQDPEKTYQKVKRALATGRPIRRNIDIFSGELGEGLCSETGLFSKITPSDLTLYFKTEQQPEGFFITSFAECHTAEQSRWSNEETLALKEELIKSCSNGQVVESTETEVDGKIHQHLFVFDPLESTRFVIALGSQESRPYLTTLMFSFEAGLSKSLKGSTDHLIPTGEEKDFVRKLQKYAKLLDIAINSMLKVKGVSQPGAIYLSPPDGFYDVPLD